MYNIKGLVACSYYNMESDYAYMCHGYSCMQVLLSPPQCQASTLLPLVTALDKLSLFNVRLLEEHLLYGQEVPLCAREERSR